MEARELAFKIICDIDKNRSYSNISINKHLKDVNLNDKDRGLVTEIVYGVLENKYYIDYMINKLSKIKVKKMSIFVKVVLRMGTYQVLFLDSISDYAAVDESVKLIKKYDRRSSGFVNAILRNEIRSKSSIINVDEKDELKRLSIRYSYKPWIIKSWVETFGLKFAKELLEEFEQKPKLYLRTNTLKISRDKLMDLFLKSKVDCKTVLSVDEAIEVKNLKNIANNELFKKGFFTVQDVSSMLVAKILNPKYGDSVLDVCSAPGGKATHIATILENTGKVVARDIHKHKLKLIKSSVDRLGLKNVEIQQFDATVLDLDIVDKFDCVLADVPCSGFGIVKRKPEIKYKDKDEIAKLNEIQENILANSSKYVKIGGKLIYSTCTIFDEENVNVVNSFLKQNNNYKLRAINEVNVDLKQQESGILKIYPNIHGIDGFFIAKLVRIR